MLVENHASRVNRIVFGARSSTEALGGLRQVGPDIWRESSVLSEKDVFEFRETKRTSTSIHLHDTRRDVRLEADLSRNMLRFTQRGQPPVDVYAIQSTFDKATGWLVKRIEFTAADGRSGAFRQTRDNAWQELDSNGNVAFHFVESGRDDWSLYLVDSTRGVEIQCDLHRNKVRFRDGSGLDTDIYDISASSNVVNGWTVREVAHGTSRGAVNGRFCETSERNWVEEVENGKAIYNFTELKRDDWSVYLEDCVRGVRIQLDLHRNKILYAQANAELADLCDIIQASAANTGWSVTVVDVGGMDSTLTRYRQSGPTSWEEAVPGRPAGFFFHEVRRDSRRVHLHDPSRHVDVEIDLQRRKVRYAEHGKRLNDLYDICNCSSGVNGRTVLKVDFTLMNGSSGGSFVKSGDTEWSELKADGTVAFDFDEIRRDDWSVYLKDNSRDVHIQLDLWRRKVRCAVGENPLTDLYLVSRYTSKITARLVNHVLFNADRRGEFGILRQTDLKEWVQDAGPDRVEAFTFRELGRDDWSVYLVDDSRNVTLQIDLWRNVILYGDAKTEIQPWYTIASATRLPHLGLKSAEKVNWVVVGDAGAEATQASFRQIGPVSWAHFNAAGQRTSTTGYSEVRRDQWNVYLVDEVADTNTLRFDLFNDRVLSSDGGTDGERLISHVLAARTKLNGWLTNSVVCTDAQSLKSYLRQTGYVAWMEQHYGDAATYLYDEIGRDEESITLHDPERNVGAVIDLKTRSVTYSGLANAPVLSIAQYDRKPELWMTARRMTSRSDLTEAMEVSGDSRQSRPVYRSSLSLPQLVTHIDVSASEQISVEIDGKYYVIDGQMPVRIRASLTSKMSISMLADGLQCPAVYVRTNLMQPGERHVLLADVRTHSRLATLSDGELYNARDQLGLNSKLQKADVDQIQIALTNIARTAQHTYNQTPHGVQHDRALLPANMLHPHFKLDFAGGGATYKPLTSDEVAAHIAGAERLSPTAAQGFFDDIGDFFKKAASIVIHTVEDVGEVIVDTAKHVVTDVVDTVDQVGEDLIHGDILEAGKDLIQGGEHVGGDLVKGALGVGGAVVKGASQLLVATIEYGKKLVQFVIDHTGFIGKAIGWLLERAGGTLGKAVRWLLSPLGWDDILLVHDTFCDAVNRRLDELKSYAQEIKAESDSFFVNLANTISTDVEKLVHQVDAGRFTTTRPSTAQHSGAIEKVEWLLSKLFQYGHDPNPLASVVAASGGGGPLAPLENLLSDELGNGASKVREAFEDSLEQLVAVFTDNNSAPEHLLVAVLEIAKGVALLGLDIAAKIIDLVLDLMAAAVGGFKDLLNLPMDIPIMTDFYKGLTDGRPMTVLSIASLLLATPVTIIHKALTSERPFATGPALELETQPTHVKAIGNTYGSMHILMSVLGVISAGMTAFDVITDQVAEGLGAELRKTAQFNPGTTTVRGISLVLGVLAQIMANPIPVGETYVMPLDVAKNDVMEAPNYWSHVIWHCQTGFLVFTGITSVGLSVAEGNQAKLSTLARSGDVISGALAVWGVAHMALMGVLDHADRNKRDVLHNVFAPLINANLDNDGIIAEIDRQAKLSDATSVPYIRPTTDGDKITFVKNARNYYEWSRDASPGQPIPNKGFGNVMDGLPEFGQLFAMPCVVEGTEALSLIGLALAEFVGHLSEGVTYLARTANNELL